MMNYLSVEVSVDMATEKLVTLSSWNFCGGFRIDELHPNNG